MKYRSREGRAPVTIWEWRSALLRRWLVLTIGLLCTVCVVYVVHKRPVSFESCGSVVVGAPKTPARPNVYNNTEGSLVAATGLITDELQSASVQQQILAGGATGTYQAQVHNTGTTETPAYSEPEMDVCAYSINPVMSLRTSNAVLTEFGNLLRDREVAAHVQPQYFLTENVLAAPGPAPESGRPSQAYLGVGLIGLIISLSVALWIDRYLRRRPWPGFRGYAAGITAALTGYAKGAR